MANDREGQLKQILAEIENLSESPLYTYRSENGYLPVMGEGNLEAGIMFIGEAPGEREAKSGRPFIGAAGRVLDELLQFIGLARQDVYITNVVKDRPPNNRDPKPEEVALYTPFLIRQIEIIQPKVIATLGRFAMDFILSQFALPEQGQKISQLHGQRLKAQTRYGEIAVVPLYHPAVALYNRNQRQTLEADFQVLQPVIKPGQGHPAQDEMAAPGERLPNGQIADLLDQIADLMEAQGSNAYRIRSYRNGARQIRTAPESVVALAQARDKKGLKALPGIGESLANLIIEYVHTGRSTLLDELKNKG